METTARQTHRPSSPQRTFRPERLNTSCQALVENENDKETTKIPMHGPSEAQKPRRRARAKSSREVAAEKGLFDQKPCRLERVPVEMGFFGFGVLTPPKRKQRRPQQQQDANLLKNAQRLIQLTLGNDSEKLTKDSIAKAIQHQVALRTKERYSTLLEKPWRTTPEKWEPNGRKDLSESEMMRRTSQLEAKNPKTFRRSASDVGRIAVSQDSSVFLRDSEQSTLLSTHDDPSWFTETTVDEINVRPSQGPEKANFRVKCFQQENSGIFQASDESDALLSINDNLGLDDDASDAFSAKSGEPRSTSYQATPGFKSKTSHDKAITAGAHRNKIAALEKQLADSDAKFKIEKAQRECNKLKNDVATKDKWIADVEASLNATKAQNDIESTKMHAKIATLEEELVYLEAKLHDSEQQKSEQMKEMKENIDNLVKQLTYNTEENLRAVEPQTTIIQDFETLLKQNEKEIDSAKINAAVANAAAESAELKLKQLEESSNKVVKTLQNQLANANNKTKVLHEELSNLLPLTTEMAKVKLNLQIVETKLKKSEKNEKTMQAREEVAKQTALKLQDETNTSIALLEESLVAANERCGDATRRLEDLEAAQAREQQILSEELRESETTIACLVEELNMLKLLSTDLEKAELHIQEIQAETKLKDDEFADIARDNMELRAALKISEAEVDKLRNELRSLRFLTTNLDEAERQIQKAWADMELMKQDLAEKVGDNEELRSALIVSATKVNELRTELESLKPLASDLAKTEQDLRDTLVKLELHEQAIARNISEACDVQDLRASLSSAEQEVDVVRTELESLKPLASAFAGNVQELRASLSLSEQEVDVLRTELESLKPLASDIAKAEQDLQDTLVKLELHEQAIARYILEACDVQDLRASLSLAEQEVDVLRIELESLKPLAVDFAKSEQDLQDTLAKLELKEQDITRCRAEAGDVQELRASLSSAEQEVDVLRTKLESLKPLASDLAKAEQDLKDTLVKLDLNEQEIARCVAEAGDVQKLRASLSWAEQEVDLVRTELESLKPLASDLAKAEQDLQDTLSMLKQNEQEIARCMAEAGDVQELRASLRYAEQEKDVLRTELALMKPLASDLAKTKQELHEALAKLEREEHKLEATQGNEDFQALQVSLEVAEQQVLKLKNKLHLLQPLASDLEDAEWDLHEARVELKLKVIAEMAHTKAVEKLEAALQQSEAEIAKLRNDLEMSVAQASYLKHTERELNARAKQTLAVNQVVGSTNQDDIELQVMLQPDEIEVTHYRKGLLASGSGYEMAEERATELINRNRADVEKLHEELDEANTFSASLQKELDDLQHQLEVADDEISTLISEAAEYNSQVRVLQQMLDDKESEIRSLNDEVAEQKKQISAIQKHVTEMEEERNYSQAKITELASLTDVRNKGDPEKRLYKKSVECAELFAEREVLKKKLTAFEALATALEKDNKQQKALVQDFTFQNGDSSSSLLSIEACVDSLQKEQNRTLERCADLSLQLAESQYKIDELTKELRKTQQKSQPQAERPPVSPEKQTSFYCQSPSRKSFKVFLNSGIDRLMSKGLDESLGSGAANRADVSARRHSEHGPKQMGSEHGSSKPPKPSSDHGRL